MTQHKSRKSSFKNEDLYIVTMISNPLRYESRYDLYEKFYTHLRNFTDNIWTVEVSTGDRTHQITERSNPQHIQLTSTMESSVVWQKEPGWNIGGSRLPREAENVAFLDADIQFANQDWIQETLHALQHYKIVQPFESVVNLGPTGAFLDTWQSAGYAIMNGLTVNSRDDKGNIYGSFFHPGFGFAMKTSTFSEIGGFMTNAILGSADHQMVMALLGRAHETYPEAIHPLYKASWLEYQNRLGIHIRGNVGATPGTITHNFHGDFKNRRYKSRWGILLDHEYNPHTDIKNDHQGLVQLTQAGMRMYGELLRYYKDRNEDSPHIARE